MNDPSEHKPANSETSEEDSGDGASFLSGQSAGPLRFLLVDILILTVMAIIYAVYAA